MTGPTFPCEDCGRTFGGYRGYRDAHVGGVCATKRQLRARGLIENDAGVWVRPDPTNTQAVLFPKTPVNAGATTRRAGTRRGGLPTETGRSRENVESGGRRA